MDLQESIIKLCYENINEYNSWYIWDFNESHLPFPIEFPSNNLFHKNIYLKEILHDAWKLENDKIIKGKIIKYYISDWGGIRTNSDESMKAYMFGSPSEYIKQGKVGIPSWSKALVIHNPNKYAIFDARVSTSLNCLQILFNAKSKILFPVLSSRNRIISDGGRKIKYISKHYDWKRLNDSEFYYLYLELLKNVARQVNTSISTVEMLLFAKAENIVSEV